MYPILIIENSSVYNYLLVNQTEMYYIDIRKEDDANYLRGLENDSISNGIKLVTNERVVIRENIYTDILDKGLENVILEYT